MNTRIIDGTTPKELLRSESAQVKCELCGALGPTVTHHKVGTLTYLASALVCFAGGTMGCCFIPCCMDTCMDTEHQCSACRQPLHTYRKI